ncbi:MAG: GNAT family N-acetyltransferase [Sorangiineae bacterium]|nr:GNAT family N-acetyltransferase [Polyangiaceae bacterium]MEB2324416.1 GNAT family N-acetyltransferase [Sorangiineae bacterium]
MTREIELEPPVFETARLRVRMLAPEAAARMCRYHLDNRAHLARWEPPRPPGFFTEDFWEWRLERSRDEYLADQSLHLSLEARDDPDGPLVGQASLSHFVRGALQGCTLGYSLGAAFEGRGLMQEALAPLLAHAFGPLAFHRVEANHGPENLRSARLLARLGFEHDGLARRYLYIDGAWRDHVRTVLLNPAPMRPPALG